MPAHLPFKTQKAADPLGPPSLTVEYVLGLVTMLVGLFATQGLISNHVEKLVTGLASILVPLILVIVQAVIKSQAHKAKVNVKVAEASNPPVGVSLGEYQKLAEEQTAKIVSAVQPPSAQDVASQIIKDAAGNQAATPSPPAV